MQNVGGKFSLLQVYLLAADFNETQNVELFIFHGCKITNEIRYNKEYLTFPEHKTHRLPCPQRRQRGRRQKSSCLYESMLLSCRVIGIE